MGRIRFSLKLAAALIVGFGIGAGWGWINGQKDELSRPVLFQVSGLVDISPSLRSGLKPSDVLFIVAAAPGSSWPYAVARVSPVSLPYMYTLGPQNRMLAGEPLPPSARLAVSARIDRDGRAGPAQPGDLVGESAQGAVIPPARNVNVLIDTVVQ